MSGGTSQKVLANFGRLWGRGHEVLGPELRRVISIQGVGATQYLQNLVTCDLLSAPTPPRPEVDGAPQPGVPKQVIRQQQAAVAAGEENRMAEFTEQLRAACFLDNKGRIVTDSLVWKVSADHYYLDVPATAADHLLQHLQLYKLRRTKVNIADTTDDMATAVIYGTLNAPGSPPGYLAALDPRHPSLGMRVLKLPTDASSSGPTLAQFSQVLSSSAFPDMTGNYELVRRLAGVAEGVEIAGKVALETNQEHLNAVSFHKGCYLGQELTARVHHTGVLRKRIMPLLLLDVNTQVPQPWILAANLQQGRALKRFTMRELKQLPSRLPRLSVLTAGNLVAISTGSVQPADTTGIDAAAAAELQTVQERAQLLLDATEKDCVMGAKMTDETDPGKKTIGQIVSAPVKGTNVVLALMRLESVGLLTAAAGGSSSTSAWSHTNKIKIGASEFRYLPYLPLWWPELDPATGKAREPSASDEEEIDPEAREETEEDRKNSESKLPRMELEELTLNEGSSDSSKQ